MFDAKSLIEMMMRGAGGGEPQRGNPAGGGPAGGGLGDILGQILAQVQQPAGQPAGGPSGQPRGAGVPGLEDLMRQLGGGGAGGGGRAPQEPDADSLEAEQPGAGPPGGGPLGGPDGMAQGGGAPAGGAAGGGSLADILAQLQRQLGGGGQGGGQGGGGGLMDILGQVLGQATAGVKEGAQRVDEATGASGHVRDAVGRATGQSPDDVLAQLKDLVAKHQLGAGVAAGGLGAVLLGTKTGRSITTSALKLGGLALIGGLAYKALQNYQQGKPLIAGGQAQALAAAPAGSGYEVDAIGNESALLYIRGMIAAAAADGRIDSREQAKLLGGLQQAGLGAHAEEFLAEQLNNPPTVADLVAGVQSEQEAVQLFTAARVAIDLDTDEEHDFLVNLAQGLGLDGKLVAHIDAAARAAG